MLPCAGRFGCISCLESLGVSMGWLFCAFQWTHWVGAKVHVTLCVDLYSGQILVFSMTLMTVCVLSSV